MKYRSILSLLVASVMLAFVGCTPAEPVEEAPTEPSFDMVSFAPIQGMWMYVETTPVEGVRHFEFAGYTGIDRGERLLSDGVEIEGMLDKSDGGESAMTYVEVERKEGERLFMSATYFVPNAQLGAVVGEETVIYEEASRRKPSANIMPRMSLVVIPKDDQESDGQGFYQITGWDNERETGVAKQYVLKDQVSLKDADVQSLIFFLIAEETDNEVQKKALLTSASEIAGSVFLPEIDEALYELVGGGEAEAPAATDREIYTLAGEAAVNSNSVSLYDGPAESGTVIGTMSMGQSVTISERTANTFDNDADGGNDYWYKVSSPDREGWVFGTYLDLQ